MTDRSAIEWTQATWNPVTGCTQVSPGCAHCYAETFAERFRGVPGHPYQQGFDLRLWPERLDVRDHVLRVADQEGVGEAFEIVLNMAALGIIASWATIVLCQMKLFKMTNAGIMRLAPFADMTDEDFDRMVADDTVTARSGAPQK